MSAVKKDKALVVDALYLGVSMLSSWLLLRWMLKQIDPNRKTAEAAKAKRRALSRRLGRPITTDGPYEDAIAQEVVNPETLDSDGLEAVGGLDDVIADVRRHVLLPLARPELFRTTLLRSARGVLLYGPPGTGKTLLARAIAREAHACFITLRASTLLSKWYGDTNRLVAATWSLATKLAPCVVFLDEVDALLGSRRSSDHEASTALKTEFMQLWDGFAAANRDAPVLVLGATNRREDLDEAVLRRFSLQYRVSLPDAQQRAHILAIHVARHAREVGDEAIDPALLAQARGEEERRAEQRRAGRAAHASPDAFARAIGAPQTPGDPPARGASASDAPSPSSSPAPAATSRPSLPERSPIPLLDALAASTEGYSGSDLTELCSRAATMPFHDAVEGLTPPGGVAQLNVEHFHRALAAAQPPSRAARAAQGVAPTDTDSMRALSAILSGVLGGGRAGSGGDG